MKIQSHQPPKFSPTNSPVPTNSAVPLPPTAPAVAAVPSTPTLLLLPIDVFISIQKEVLDAMRKPELKKELRIRNLNRRVTRSLNLGRDLKRLCV